MGGGSSWSLIWITDASLESDTQIAAGTAAPLELFAIFGTKFLYVLTRNTVCKISRCTFRKFSRNLEHCLIGKKLHAHPGAILFCSEDIAVS